MAVNQIQLTCGDSWNRAKVISRGNGFVEVSSPHKKLHAFIPVSAISSWTTVKKTSKPKLVTIRYTVSGIELTKSCRPHEVEKYTDALKSSGCQIL